MGEMQTTAPIAATAPTTWTRLWRGTVPTGRPCTRLSVLLARVAEQSDPMALSPDQFPEYPYPRLRENYARNWASRMAEISNDEGDSITDGRMLLEAGRDQAKTMTELHMRDPKDDFAKSHLMRLGFSNRQEARKNYASWYN